MPLGDFVVPDVHAKCDYYSVKFPQRNRAREPESRYLFARERKKLRTQEGVRRFNYHRAKLSPVHRVAAVCCVWHIRVILARNTSAEKWEVGAIRGVTSVTWKVYISMSVERHSRSGRPFASLPSSLYGSGIAKQVFIARSRRAQELSQTNGNGTHGRGERRKDKEAAA